MHDALEKASTSRFLVLNHCGLALFPDDVIDRIELDEVKNLCNDYDLERVDLSENDISEITE